MPPRYDGRDGNGHDGKENVAG
ncbi:MAG: hypothetical protein QOF95_2510, partial [Pseudonocardiales bacterium]|nr:hypothetical protein [Pseudonocardiales bacterium]